MPVRISGPSVSPVAAGATRPGPLLEVVLRNGRVLRVPPGTDPALVVQMASALEGPPDR